jgi:signal peptidase I
MKYTPEKTSLLLPVSLAFFLALLTKLFFFDIMIAEGHSMEPTIKEGSIILINKLAYGLQVPFFKKHLFRWAEPQVGDILVFIAPDNRFAVKRCVLTADTESQIMDRPP